MVAHAKRSVIASLTGLKQLEAKRRMSGKTAGVIGDLAGVSRSSAQKFFKGKPIAVENFQALCKVLDLDWKEIAESEAIASSATARKRVAFVIEGSLDDLDPTKLAKLQAMVRALQQLTGDASITTVEIEEGSIRLILEGSEDGIEKLKQLFDEGELILEGSEDGIEKLKQLFDEGELAEVLGTPVRAVELSKSNVLNIGEVRGDCLKALLISKIRSQGAWRADLSGADLSGADLSGADLSGADLSNSIASAHVHARDLDLDLTVARYLASALTSVCDLDLDFARALDLTHALAPALDLTRYLNNYHDYHHAHTLALACARALARARYLVSALDLTRYLDHYRARYLDLTRDLALAATLANFSDANFSDANFSGANFSDANFSDANFSGAVVEDAHFGEGIGLTESEKRDLKRRGAIFDEFTGDREFIRA